MKPAGPLAGAGTQLGQDAVADDVRLDARLDAQRELDLERHILRREHDVLPAGHAQGVEMVVDAPAQILVEILGALGVDEHGDRVEQPAGRARRGAAGARHLHRDRGVVLERDRPLERPVAQRHRQLLLHAREGLRLASAARRHDVRHPDVAQRVERDLLVGPGRRLDDVDERAKTDVAGDWDRRSGSAARARLSGRSRASSSTSWPWTPSPKRSHTLPPSSASAV